MSKYHYKQALFVEAIKSTANDSGFSAALIEKDYYCSLVLQEFFQSSNCHLIFKGGTLLSKVHAGFYRLSEDLDFSISIKPDASRKERRILADSSKQFIKNIIHKLSFGSLKDFEGRDENRLYTSEIVYYSLITANEERIKLELGLHEIVLEPKNLIAKTLLIDPISQKSAFPDFSLKCLGLKEAYSEKIRAALSRRKPAIRDVFDIDYAIKKQLIDIKDIVSMVKYKLDVLNRKIDLSDYRKEEFLHQIQTELKPVLLQKDFEKFDFKRAWNSLKTFEEEILELKMNKR